MSLIIYHSQNGNLLGGADLENAFLNGELQACILNEQINRLHHQGIPFALCSHEQYHNRPQPPAPEHMS